MPESEVPRRTTHSQQVSISDVRTLETSVDLQIILNLSNNYHAQALTAIILSAQNWGGFPKDAR